MRSLQPRTANSDTRACRRILLGDMPDSLRRNAHALGERNIDRQILRKYCEDQTYSAVQHADQTFIGHVGDGSRDLVDRLKLEQVVEGVAVVFVTQAPDFGESTTCWVNDPPMRFLSMRSKRRLR